MHTCVNLFFCCFINITSTVIYELLFKEFSNLQNRNYWIVPPQEQQLIPRSLRMNFYFYFSTYNRGRKCLGQLLCYRLTLITDVTVWQWNALLFTFKAVFNMLIRPFNLQSFYTQIKLLNRILKDYLQANEDQLQEWTDQLLHNLQGSGYHQEAFQRRRELAHQRECPQQRQWHSSDRTHSPRQ